MENLLSNAVKFSPDGGKITATLEKTDKKVKIIITDTGIGIPKKDFAHIFEKFYRAVITCIDESILGKVPLLLRECLLRDGTV